MAFSGDSMTAVDTLDTELLRLVSGRARQPMQAQELTFVHARFNANLIVLVLASIPL